MEYAVLVDVVNNSCDEEKITLKQIRKLIGEIFTDMFKKHEEMLTRITESLHETWDVCEEKIKDVVKKPSWINRKCTEEQ